MKPAKASGAVTFFDKIDSPEKAYFLGFLATDGTVHSNSKTISLAVAEKDVQILVDFLEVSGWKTEIRVKKHKYPQVVINLCSCYLVSSLKSWGFSSKKSLTFELLKSVPDSFASDFVRGVWDGDGWIGERQFSFCSGSEVFIHQVKNLILDHTGQELSITKPSGRNHLVLHGGRKTASAIRWIYSKNFPVLSRKAIQISRFWS